MANLARWLDHEQNRALDSGEEQRGELQTAHETRTFRLSAGGGRAQGAVTSPVKRIEVRCPHCGTEYTDWHRPSVNIDLQQWDTNDPQVAAYLRDCSTATCPSCGHVVELEALVVDRDMTLCA